MQSLHDILHLDSRVGAALGTPVLRGRKPIPFSPNAAMDCSCMPETTMRQHFNMLGREEIFTGVLNRTFLLTCVPTEGCFNCCVPIFFGAVGLRGGTILCVPCRAGLALSLWVVIAADIILACCSGDLALGVCEVSLHPTNAF